MGHIKDSIRLIRQNKQAEVDIRQVRKLKEDPKLNERLATEIPSAVLHESPAMRMLLRKLQVSDYLTLVAASSIIRPA